MTVEREEQVAVLHIGAGKLRRAAAPRPLLAAVIIDHRGERAVAGRLLDAAVEHVAVARKAHLLRGGSSRNGDRSRAPEHRNEAQDEENLRRSAHGIPPGLFIGSDPVVPPPSDIRSRNSGLRCTPPWPSPSRKRRPW